MERKIKFWIICFLGILLLKGFVFVNLVDIEGQRVNLRNNTKGKVILLSFFATTCKPCQKELPEINKMLAEMNGSKLEFILVSEDGSDVSSDTITAFLKPIFNDKMPKILRDIYHQQYQLNAERGSPVSIPRNVILVNGKAVLDIRGFHEDSIQKIQSVLKKQLTASTNKKRSVYRLDFHSQGVEEAGKAQYISLVKAFCASHNVIANESLTDTSADILRFEIKPVGSYKLFKVSLIDSAGTQKRSKSVVVYQEAESKKKLKSLVNQVFSN
ncbi:TlpA family protein disulfide reductase [bacterium]|nr:TlpA family protein disulfide reductase [bacterium]